jgi:O-antigen/teichoic acid export membrane protein
MAAGNYRLDQWILGSISGSHQLGLYSVAVAWAEALFFLPHALTLAFRPDLVRATPESARVGAASSVRFAMIATVPLAVGLVVAAPFLCVTILGEDFSGSVEQLRLLVPGAFGIVAIKILGNALVAQGRPLLETAAVAIAFVLTVALDVLLIPPHGGVGAAVASTLAYTAAGAAIGAIFLRALGGHAGELLPRREDATLAVTRLRTVLRPARQRGTS